MDYSGGQLTHALCIPSSFITLELYEYTPLSPMLVSIPSQTTLLFTLRPTRAVTAAGSRLPSALPSRTLGALLKYFFLFPSSSFLPPSTHLHTPHSPRAAFDLLHHLFTTRSRLPSTLALLYEVSFPLCNSLRSTNSS